MVRVKICGITNVADARLAAKLGADALGFNFYEGSPRCMAKERVRAITAVLPPLVVPVGLFVNQEPDEIREICRYCGIDTVQLHGDESPSDVAGLPGFKRIKAIRIADERDLRLLPRYAVDAYLLDAHSPEKYGGTGKTFDWAIAREALKYGPIILAGGLNPDNVADAIAKATPYAVDTASGVESEPGRKDSELMAAFIASAKAAKNR